MASAMPARPTVTFPDADRRHTLACVKLYGLVRERHVIMRQTN